MKKDQASKVLTGKTKGDKTAAARALRGGKGRAKGKDKQSK